MTALRVSIREEGQGSRCAKPTHPLGGYPDGKREGVFVRDFSPEAICFEGLPGRSLIPGRLFLLCPQLVALLQSALGQGLRGCASSYGRPPRILSCPKSFHSCSHDRFPPSRLTRPKPRHNPTPGFLKYKNTIQYNTIQWKPLWSASGDFRKFFCGIIR